MTDPVTAHPPLTATASATANDPTPARRKSLADLFTMNSASRRSSTRTRTSIRTVPRRMRTEYRAGEREHASDDAEASGAAVSSSSSTNDLRLSRRYSTLGVLASSTGTLPPTPLYLFRAPGVQLRIGLPTDTYRAGDRVDGTVVLYRDGEGGDGGEGAINLEGAMIEVALLCETARRKVNHSYRAGQLYRPQDIGAGRLFRYSYTRTLVPASHKWAQGPFEARHHSCVAPFMPPVRAAVAPAIPMGSRTSTYRFGVRLPQDAPASATWCEEKRHASVDLRYRLVALAHFESHTTVMAETVLLVSHHPAAVHRPPPPTPVIARASTHLARRSVHLSLPRRAFLPNDAPQVRVQLRGVTPIAPLRVVLVERVSYAGKVRYERAVAAEAVADDRERWTLRAAGFYSDLALGPLCVRHEVRVSVPGTDLNAHARVVILAPAVAEAVLRASTRSLRRQPPVHYYWQDELPHHANLEYRTVHAPAADSSSAPLAIAALADRLPVLSADPDLKFEACCLCLDDLGTQRVTRLAPCAHVLHHACAQEWLRHLHAAGHRTASCPLCKADVQ